MLRLPLTHTYLHTHIHTHLSKNRRWARQYTPVTRRWETSGYGVDDTSVSLHTCNAVWHHLGPEVPPSARPYALSWSHAHTHTELTSGHDVRYQRTPPAPPALMRSSARSLIVASLRGRHTEAAWGRCVCVCAVLLSLWGPIWVLHLESEDIGVTEVIFCEFNTFFLVHFRDWGYFLKVSEWVFWGESFQKCFHSFWKWRLIWNVWRDNFG